MGSNIFPHRNCVGLCRLMKLWDSANLTLLKHDIFEGILTSPLQNSSVKSVFWGLGVIGTSQRYDVADIQPHRLHLLCATTRGFCSNKLSISVQDNRSSRNTSKQWDNIHQQEENVLSGMILNYFKALSEELLYTGGGKTRKVPQWIYHGELEVNR